jgi:hypothetical protein
MAYRVSYLCASHDIPKSLIFGIDQYGQHLMPVTDRTRVPVGTKSVPILGASDKRQITGVPVVTMDAVFVGQQLIWQGKTDRSHPKKSASHPKIFHTHSENHWSNPESMRHLVVKIIVPYKDSVIRGLGFNEIRASKQKSILLLDVWKHHLSKDFRELLASHNIEPVYVDPGCTGKSQVGDLVINRKMKSGPSDVICEEIAKKVALQLKTRANLLAAGVRAPAIQIDVKMGVLKPLVVKGLIRSIDYFESPDGKDLIRKGFVQAGLGSVFQADFIREANIFVTAGTNAPIPDRIDPQLPPALDLPPNVNAESDDALAVVTDEDFMDLVESDADEDSRE